MGLIALDGMPSWTHGHANAIPSFPLAVGSGTLILLFRQIRFYEFERISHQVRQLGRIVPAVGLAMLLLAVFASAFESAFFDRPYVRTGLFTRFALTGAGIIAGRLIVYRIVFRLAHARGCLTASP
ncbi:MAG: hypothetical protein FD153_1805 [Rhodospirillaceae bacterium]|nr:MAG: hypothetical protein FD153_1805 [Rhodospirillaceae bacterium]